MKNLPIAFRIILNILLYVLYTIFWQFVFGLMFGLVSNILWKNPPLPWDPIFVKIWIVVSFFMLVITLIFRTYFYITLDNSENEKEEESAENMKEDEKKDFIEGKDDSMKIYIEKEINK